MDLDTVLGVLFFVVFVVIPLFSGARKGGRTRPRTGTGRSSAPGRGAAAPTANAAGDEPPVTLAEIRRRVEEAQRREEERARLRRTGGERAAGPGSLVTSDPFEGRLVSAPERKLADLGGSVPAGLGREGRPEASAGQPAGGYLIGPEGAAPDPFGTGGYVLGREGAPAPATRPAGAVLGREGAPPSVTRRRASVLGREGVGGRAPSVGGLGREGVPLGPRPSVAPLVGSSRADRRSARAAAAEIGKEAAAGGRPGAGPAGATLGRAWALRTDKESILAGLVWHEVLGRPRALRHWRER